MILKGIKQSCTYYQLLVQPKFPLSKDLPSIPVNSEKKTPKLKKLYQLELVHNSEIQMKFCLKLNVNLRFKIPDLTI